jgi:tetratricopeptide (TPR) repeat protein
MICPKCGRPVEEVAEICTGCDFILDTAFLGADILDEEEALRPGAGGVDPSVFNLADAVILGDIEENSQVFETSDSGFDNRESAGARIYVSGRSQALMSPDAIPAKMHTETPVRLTPFEKHVLDFIDGKRPVELIRKAAGLDESEVKTALATLADKGVIQVIGRLLADDEAAAPQAPSKPRAPRNRTSWGEASLGSVGLVEEDDPYADIEAAIRTKSELMLLSEEQQAFLRGDAEVAGDDVGGVQKSDSAGDGTDGFDDFLPSDAERVQMPGTNEYVSLKKAEKNNPVQARGKPVTNPMADQLESLLNDDAEDDEEDHAEYADLFDGDAEPTHQLPKKPGHPRGPGTKVVSSPPSISGERIEKDFSASLSALLDDDDSSLDGEAIPGQQADVGDDDEDGTLVVRGGGDSEDLPPTGVGEPGGPARVGGGARAIPFDASGAADQAEGAGERLPSSALNPLPMAGQSEEMDETDAAAQARGAQGPSSSAEYIHEDMIIRGRPPTEAPSSTGVVQHPDSQATEYPEDSEESGESGAGDDGLPEARRIHSERTAPLPPTGRSRVKVASREKPTTPQEMKKRARQLFDEAQADYDAGRIGAARMNAKLACIYDPDNTGYRETLSAWENEVAGGGDASRPREVQLYEQAQYREVEGDIDGAIALLQEGIRINGNIPAFHNRLGVLLALHKRDYENAVQSIRLAVKLDPDNLHYKSNLGKIVSRLNQV